MKKFANARFLTGLMIYAVIVAVTFGFAFGGRYHKPAGEVSDAIAAASPQEGSELPSDGVTSATPNGGTIPDGETADALTAASPLSDTPGSYTSPDSTTGASPAPDPGTTPPPDVITEPSPAPDPGTTPPPDVITEPSPAPDPGNPSPEPGQDEEDEVDEEDEEDEPGEAFNLLFLFLPLAMFGMTFFGLSAFTRRRKEED